MRTVAIATISQYYLLSNYGSFFQHYALRKVLKGFGCRPFRVFSPEERRPLAQRISKCLVDFLRPLYWFLRRDSEWRMKTEQMRLRNRATSLFESDYKRLIGHLYEKPLFDAETMGVRGGDQVFCRDTPQRWLCEVPTNNPLITYAASTDWMQLKAHADWQAVLAERLKRFTALGLRESEGVSFARGLAPVGPDVRQVADPVQLLTASDFRSIQSRKPIFTRPTIFCYLVNIARKEDLRLVEYKRLAERMGCDLKVLGIQGTERVLPSEYRIVLSPSEFLRALDDASTFITNSYHGSVFAMTYHKNFLSIQQNCPAGTDQNLRQKELMQSFGLANRWVDWRLGAEEMLESLSTTIDWNSVDERMSVRRKESLQWLGSVLGLVEERE